MKNYWFSFGSDDPRVFTGLTPTFVNFFNQLGQTLSPPGVTEIFSGSGQYRFQYSIGYSMSIRYLIDGGAGASIYRYLSGSLDPTDALDLAIGYTASSFGSTNVEPSDVYGYLKRSHENQEGNSTFLKSSGVWSIFSRGSSTLLAVKTLTQDTTGVTKL